MLQMMDNNYNFNGQSVKDETVIGSFSANASSHSLYISASVDNTDNFDATVFSADFAAFQQAVLEACNLVNEEE